jgi:DNA-binding response OmpR family regulator
MSKSAGAASILVVDDDPEIVTMLSTRLTKRGYQVTTASDGKAAIEMARKNHPDLVLLDVMMPVLDGVGTLRAMRADGELSAVPVVMMTALPEALPKETQLYQAALIKPFREEELFAWIDKLIGPA